MVEKDDRRGGRVLCDNLYEKLCAVLVNVKDEENKPKR
jgi:hypothetical protein